MSRGITAGEQAVNRVAHATHLIVTFDTNNPGDGRIYRMERHGRVLLRAKSIKAFEALCEAFIEGFNANVPSDNAVRAMAHMRGL